MLKVLTHEGRIWFWEEGCHEEEIISIGFFESKLNYIHLNPARVGIVEKEEEYLNSSAGDMYRIREGRSVLSNLVRQGIRFTEHTIRLRNYKFRRARFITLYRVK